jgi:membrane-bound serine protease (ClpP class)
MRARELKDMKFILAIIAALILLLPACSQAASVAPVWVLDIDGEIDPAMAGYITQGIKDAQDAAAQAVLIRMDTRGGLMSSMEDIIRAFYASRIPVIVYVSPDNARAASAGGYIAMAADIAAMAPHSRIGSLSPIAAGPSGEEQKLSNTMQRKVFNDAVSEARGIATKRGRNPDWAEKGVREAANITADKAVQLHVIDLIANNDRDLMRKIDGREVKLASGETVVLHTAKAPFEERAMGAWQTFLHYLSSPMVALLLLLMATYGIIFELSNPGAILPGVVGGISAILLLYSFSVIPINAAGFAFIALAIILFLADIYAPSHGVLSVGGVISLFFGLMMLFGSPAGPMISPWILALVTLLTGGFFVFVVALGLKALKKPYIAGREGVVGHVGVAKTDLDPTGRIFVDGALWTATSESGKVEKGEKVDVLSMTGLKLTVKRREAD